MLLFVLFTVVLAVATQSLLPLFMLVPVIPVWCSDVDADTDTDADADADDDDADDEDSSIQMAPLRPLRPPRPLRHHVQ